MIVARTKPQQPDQDTPKTGGHESGGRSIARDEELKRIIKRHPQRDIPRVESIEPREAPPKE